MLSTREHLFHIPVMGLGFTIDTPVKVAHFGISSVLSIVEDHLIENMREVICKNEHFTFVAIKQEEPDSRAKRITAYLNLLHQVVERNTSILRQLPFGQPNNLSKYFDLLPDSSILKVRFQSLSNLHGKARMDMEQYLRGQITAGAIDVNIMTKVDKLNYTPDGKLLGIEYSDALAALRGFANSKLSSSVVFSAGLNPRLYSYCESFADFFPNEKGQLNKKIILKVSDFRSALIQGKFLAKKGLWVSEFRIESGLNCGGHAFATEGLLMGPILEEFKQKRSALFLELYETCSASLKLKGKLFSKPPALKITAQGGIGTAAENNFLLEHYNLDATGWGSPFLLVPEATTVDHETLQKLATAKKQDYFLSYSSPLGVAFNNFKKSSSEQQRIKRITKKRPGSPCYKKFLVNNTEFTEKPICTASREYQNLKIKQTETLPLNSEEKDKLIFKIVEKDCLCEGLGAAALISNGAELSHGLNAVTICPGPNLAFFSGTFTLKQMIDHIYGRNNILNKIDRPHLFINELRLYIDYLKNEVESTLKTASQKQTTYLNSFKENLLRGIDYYQTLIPSMNQVHTLANQMAEQLRELRNSIQLIPIRIAEVN